MIKCKKTSLLLTYVNIVYLTVLTFIQNPLKENYSMMTSSLFGYIVVFVQCVLLSLDMGNTISLIKRRNIFLAIGPIVGCLLPYSAYSGDLVSNMHEVLAYVSFGLTIMCTFISINDFKTIDYKKGKIIGEVFVIVLVVDGMLYLSTNGVVGIEEYLLLVTIVVIDCIINHFIYNNLKEKNKL